MKDKPRVVRLVVLGTVGVGKSSLCGQIIAHDFTHMHTPTDRVSTYRSLIDIGKCLIMVQVDDLFPINHSSLLSKEVSDNKKVFESVIENKPLSLLVHQENPIFAYKAIDGFLFVFDITSKESFEILEKMIEYVNSKEKERELTKHPRKTKKFLVGNKGDLANPEVKSNEIERVKQSFQIEYFKISALTNRNVDEMFESIVRQIVEEKYGLDETIESIADSEFDVKAPEKKNLFDWCDCSRRNKDFGMCKMF
jgi:GTPase SAR1 family protein